MAGKLWKIKNFSVLGQKTQGHGVCIPLYVQVMQSTTIQQKGKAYLADFACIRNPFENQINFNIVKLLKIVDLNV